MTSTPRRFLFVSLDALISDIAWQVHREGNEDCYYIASESERDIGDRWFEDHDRLHTWGYLREG